MNAIETNKLTRAFGSLVAVDDLTLSIPEGTVFGFLVIIAVLSRPSAHAEHS